MNAVILAAGRGERLRPFTQHQHKCLLEFGGVSLLRRHLLALPRVGIESISIVTGYLANQVESEVLTTGCDSAVDLIQNGNYELGSALSLLRASAAFRNRPCLIMDADILFPLKMLRQLVEADFPNCLLVDGRLEDTGEEVKVVASSERRVTELGKRVGASSGRICGECVGIFKFSSKAGILLERALHAAVRFNPRVEYEQVFDQLLGDIDIRCVETGDLPWLEIDFSHDVERAREVVWPMIRKTEETPEGK